MKLFLNDQMVAGDVYVTLSIGVKLPRTYRVGAAKLINLLHAGARELFFFDKHGIRRVIMSLDQRSDYIVVCDPEIFIDLEGLIAFNRDIPRW